MNKRFFLQSLAALLLGSAIDVESATVRTEHADYFVQSNERITVRLIYDADDAAPGDQLPEGGFFSVGAAINFPGGTLAGTEDDVQLPVALDSDGLGDPPLKEVSTVRAGAAGAVDVLAGGAPHSNVVFLTLTLTNVAIAGSYSLNTGLFLDPPLNNFISGAGVPLDSSITGFGSATVHVLPGIPSPVIESLTSPAINQWSLVISDANGLPEVYEIERAADLNAPIQWEPVPQVTIQPIGPGRFEATFADASPQRFYRIRSLYPGGG